MRTRQQERSTPWAVQEHSVDIVYHVEEGEVVDSDGSPIPLSLCPLLPSRWDTCLVRVHVIERSEAREGCHWTANGDPGYPGDYSYELGLRSLELFVDHTAVHVTMDKQLRAFKRLTDQIESKLLGS